MLYLFNGEIKKNAGEIKKIIEQEFFDTETSKNVCHCKEKLPNKIIISPSLNITIDDFPEEFSFGNGVTCHSPVILNNKDRIYLNWIIFPHNSKELSTEEYEKLRKIIEE